jgi:hypothetical protein
LALLCIFLLAVAPQAYAHPVAQGALDIMLASDRITVQATVSSEEVLVAAAYGGGTATSILDAVRRHGEYLRAHLSIKADGRALAGRVIAVPERIEGPLAYRLDDPLTTTPTRVELTQNVLREFEFAPGNPWEASYLIRLGVAGRPVVEGGLLTATIPFVFEPRSPAADRPRGIDQARLAGVYVRHGVTHILTGYDHLLFVAALALSVLSLWELVKVISVFTLAHTLTLVLSVLDLIRLPGVVVEPVIAASIVVVALQNVFGPERRAGRLVVPFLFGLFHGLGFAGGLLEAMAGLPATGAALAIAAFSVGVELGHQLVVLPVFAGLVWLRRAPRGGMTDPAILMRRYGSGAISLGGMVYLIAALR